MNKIKVFYDGRCHLCDREIKHYLRIDADKNLEPIDITSPSFNADSYGLDQREVNTHLHVLDSDGKVFTKIDAFIEIWRRVPYYGLAARVASNRLIKFFMDKAYIVFAEYIRPYLPKKKCTTESCDI